MVRMHLRVHPCTAITKSLSAYERFACVREVRTYVHVFSFECVMYGDEF